MLIALIVLTIILPSLSSAEIFDSHNGWVDLNASNSALDSTCGTNCSIELDAFDRLAFRKPPVVHLTGCSEIDNEIKKYLSSIPESRFSYSQSGIHPFLSRKPTLSITSTGMRLCGRAVCVGWLCENLLSDYETSNRFLRILNYSGRKRELLRVISFPKAFDELRIKQYAIASDKGLERLDCEVASPKDVPDLKAAIRLCFGTLNLY